jgi:hypothetical protein
VKNKNFIRAGSAVIPLREEAKGGPVVSPDSDQTSLTTTSPSSLTGRSGFLSRVSVIPFEGRGYSSGLIYDRNTKAPFEERAHSSGLIYSKQKLWLRSPLLLLIFFVLVGRAKAASSINIDIHVSVNATKSLSIDSTSYTFPAIAVNSASVSASSITVTNDSNGVVETYQILGATATSGSADVWDLSDTAVGPNTFMLGAIFHNGTQPAVGDFHANSWLNKTTNVVADGVNKLTDGTETGVDVPVGGKRHLWFKFASPTSVLDPSDHKTTIVLSVN